MVPGSGPMRPGAESKRACFRITTLLSITSTIVAANNQISSDLGGEVAILNLKNGVYYGLNEVGARIWELIQKPRALNEIRDIILDEYVVEVERCERDMLELLTKMAAEGLIEVKNETNS